MKSVVVNVSVQLSLLVPTDFDTENIESFLNNVEYSFQSVDDDVSIENTDMFDYDLVRVHFLPILPLDADNIWNVPSSDGITTYAVAKKGDEWSCECESFKYRGECKHIKQIKAEL